MLPDGYFGDHIMIDVYQAEFKPEHFRAEFWEGWMRRVADLLNMKPLGDPIVHEVPPVSEKDAGGITAFLIVVESHIAVHMFKRERFIAIDIFSCKTGLSVYRFVKEVMTEFGERVDVYYIKRGKRFYAD